MLHVIANAQKTGGLAAFIDAEHALSSNGKWQSQVMFETGVLITSFGQDESGEIYLASDTGNIYHLAIK